MDILLGDDGGQDESGGLGGGETVNRSWSMFMGRMSWMLNSQCQVSHLHQLTRSSTPARGRGNVNPSSVRRDRDDKHVNNQAAQSTRLGILKKKERKNNNLHKDDFCFGKPAASFQHFFSSESSLKPNKWKVCGGSR